ncbi:MAG: Ltp family lipoprotein [Coriobacteriales bacterium]
MTEENRDARQTNVAEDKAAVLEAPAAPTRGDGAERHGEPEKNRTFLALVVSLTALVLSFVLTAVTGAGVFAVVLLAAVVCTVVFGVRSLVAYSKSMKAGAPVRPSPGVVLSVSVTGLVVTVLLVVCLGVSAAAGPSPDGSTRSIASTSEATPTPAPKVVAIAASYTGSTDAGTSVSSDNFAVTAQFDNGKTGKVPSGTTVTLRNPGTLGDGTTTTFVLDAGGCTCSVDVTGKHVATKEESNALNKATSYANTMHMSKKGVYDQLTSEYGEGFPASAAQYAVDNVQADWNANALYKAKSYQDTMHMSRSRIYDQLTSEYGEQFTPDEAQYAIDHLDQ